MLGPDSASIDIRRTKVQLVLVTTGHGYNKTTATKLTMKTICCPIDMDIVYRRTHNHLSWTSWHYGSRGMGLLSQQQQRFMYRSFHRPRREQQRQKLWRQKQQQRRRYPRIPPSIVLSVLIVAASIVVVNLWELPTKLFVDAAHSARRRPVSSTGGNNLVKYDREITTFSPDGRLSQVEYALEAARRGSSVMGVKLSSQLPGGQNPNNNNRNHEMVIVCVESSSSSSSPTSSTSPSDGKVHRIDDHVWMMTSGLSGDARFLATKARSWCQVYKQTYGEAPTPQQVATDCIATYHHDLTRRSGVRPLGCSALIVGVNSRGKESNFGGGRTDHNHIGGTVSMYQVEPGGGVSSPTSTVSSFSPSHKKDKNDSGDPEGRRPLSLELMHVIGRHQQDVKMLSDIERHIETGLMMASNNIQKQRQEQQLQQQQKGDISSDVIEDANKEAVETNANENDTALKAAMIVADSFFRQIDPAIGGKERARRTTKPADTKRSSREGDDDFPTTKSLDVWVIQPSSHHGNGCYRYRGEMVTTCFKNINRQCTEALLLQLSNEGNGYSDWRNS